MPEEKYNADELVPPSFLNDSYVQNFLRDVEQDPELHVINYEIIPGSGIGDHYASVMFKVIATYGTKGRVVDKRRFVLKTVPDAAGDKKKMLDNVPVFEFELKMYQKVLPAMDELLAKHGEKGWWPKLVFAQDSPAVLIFDDLTVDNWQVSHDPLSQEEYPMIVDKIAKYHALSCVLMEEMNFEDYNLNQVPNDEHLAGITNGMTHLIRTLGKIIKEWKGYELMGEKIEKYSKNAPKMMFQTRAMKIPGEFIVLNHGDFHIRNMMVKKGEDGKLVDILFLDFQAPLLSVPAFDLIGMLVLMCDHNVQKKEREVIKEYHEKLIFFLKKFGFTSDLPTVADIHVGILKMHQYHGFTRLLSAILRVKGFSLEDIFNMDKNPEVKAAIIKTFSEPDIEDYVKETLARFDSLNVYN